MTNTEKLATRLHDAYANAESIDPATLPSNATTEDAYAVQDAFIENRTADEGPVVGYKLGFTNETVQSDVGVDSPIYGRILKDTIHWNREFDVDSLIEPQIEPEIAFVLEEDLDQSANRLDVMAATRHMIPVIEVVDSRISDWDLTVPGAVTDNALAARLLPGDRTATEIADLPLESVEVSINGEQRASGVGAAVLGHPADAVAWLADTLSDRGDSLQAGDIVTTGSLTEPVPVTAGDTIVARFSSLGTVVAQSVSSGSD
ncbi:MAG: fumarylacetoacetate hydrolase family protein [Natronomonas sp.]